MRGQGVLVVGGGIAAQAVVEAVRERDSEVPVTMVSAETRLPYDRQRLSELLITGSPVESVQLRPDAWYADCGVEVVLGKRVVRLDPEAGTVATGDGEILFFERVCLATGSEALMPPIDGLDKQGVHAFRYPEDCDRIAAASEGAMQGAVIGGGLLGLEAARGLAARGCPVTVVHLMDRLMERQLDEGAAEMLGPAMEELGVDVLLERSTAEVLGNGRVEGLRFADGEALECDLVVVSAGIRARCELARDAGLDCERGIVVDDSMRTSAVDVFAVGECAQHRGIVYGIVAPIYEQADVAAETMLEHEGGRDYGGSIMSTKLKVMGVDLVALGEAEGERSVVVEDREAGVYRKLAVRDGAVAGAILLGDTRGHELLLDRVKEQASVDDPLELLAEASAATAAELSDGAQVCDCNGVCKGTIVEAIHGEGFTNVQEVCTFTRAGTGCGSCKPLVGELVRIETGQADDEPTYLCPCRKLTRDELAALIREQRLEAVSEVGEACGAGRDCGACKPGLSYLVSEINDNRHREERAARFINDRVHANIQKDGTFSVVPRIRGGVTSPEELRRIADVAERHGVRMVKITGGQRIDLLGVKKEKLPAIWEELGMPSGHAYAKAVRTVKTCVGSDFCRFGLDDSIGLGVELEREWEGLHTPHKVKSGVSGCPRNCAEASTKDIGVIAIEGGWQVRVGGAAGMRVRESDVLATVETRAQAKRLATVFLQHYRESADYLERTYDYVERVGIDSIRELLLDEDSEEPARLLERFRLAKAAVLDPWLERRDPVHSKQFAELDSDPEFAPVGPPPGGGVA